MFIDLSDIPSYLVVINCEDRPTSKLIKSKRAEFNKGVFLYHNGNSEYARELAITLDADGYIENTKHKTDNLHLKYYLHSLDRQFHSKSGCNPTIEKIIRMVDLTSSEQELFTILYSGRGKFMSKNNLQTKLIGRSKNLINVHVYNIRRKFSAHSIRDIILSKDGCGYRLNLAAIPSL